MSASAAPISPARFASAIKDLPLGNLHSSAAELRNSIAHLRSSNQQLRPFAEGEDADIDCADAIRENEEVIESMVGRIEMLKREAEGRGFKWVEPEEGVNGHVGGNEDDEDDEDDDDDEEEEEEEEEEERREDNSAARGGSTSIHATTRPSHGRSIGDEELRRLVEERLHGADDGDDGGLDLWMRMVGY